MVVVLATGHVEVPVQSVFNIQVPAHKHVGLHRRERPAADIIPLLQNGLSTFELPSRFHPHQRVQSEPAAVRVYPAQVGLRPDSVA